MSALPGVIDKPAHATPATTAAPAANAALAGQPAGPRDAGAAAPAVRATTARAADALDVDGPVTATLLRLLPWLVPVGLVLGWQAAIALGWLSTDILPAPTAVAKAFWELVASGDLWTYLQVSGWRALSGFAVGGSLGVGLGLLTGMSRWAEAAFDSSVQMVRNIPHLALIPLVILWFGIDEGAKRFLVAAGVFFPLYINTHHGIRAVDRQLIEMARSYGLRGFALYRDVILPGALPSILVGLRFALGVMWLSLIVAETISAQSGIGYMTMNAREFLQTDIVLVGVLLYALLGKLADLVAKGLERRWLRWNPAYAKARR